MLLVLSPPYDAKQKVGSKRQKLLDYVCINIDVGGSIWSVTQSVRFSLDMLSYVCFET